MRLSMQFNDNKITNGMYGELLRMRHSPPISRHLANKLAKLGLVKRARVGKYSLTVNGKTFIDSAKSVTGDNGFTHFCCYNGNGCHIEIEIDAKSRRWKDV